jgi:hypothetical protein
MACNIPGLGTPLVYLGGGGLVVLLLAALCLPAYSRNPSPPPTAANRGDEDAARGIVPIAPLARNQAKNDAGQKRNDLRVLAKVFGKNEVSVFITERDTIEGIIEGIEEVFGAQFLRVVGTRSGVSTLIRVDSVLAIRQNAP